MNRLKTLMFDFNFWATSKRIANFMDCFGDFANHLAMMKIFLWIATKIRFRSFAGFANKSRNNEAKM